MPPSPPGKTSDRLIMIQLPLKLLEASRCNMYRSLALLFIIKVNTVLENTSPGSVSSCPHTSGTRCNGQWAAQLKVSSWPRHLQRFWGASGDFWQDLWTRLYLQYEGHPASLFYLGESRRPPLTFSRAGPLEKGFSGGFGTW